MKNEEKDGVFKKIINKIKEISLAQIFKYSILAIIALIFVIVGIGFLITAVKYLFFSFSTGKTSSIIEAESTLYYDYKRIPYSYSTYEDLLYIRAEGNKELLNNLEEYQTRLQIKKLEEIRLEGKKINELELLIERNKINDFLNFIKENYKVNHINLIDNSYQRKLTLEKYQEEMKILEEKIRMIKNKSYLSTDDIKELQLMEKRLSELKYKIEELKRAENYYRVNLYIEKNLVFDTYYYKKTWKDSISEFFSTVNNVLRSLTIGLINFVLKVINYLVYVIISVILGLLALRVTIKIGKKIFKI